MLSLRNKLLLWISLLILLVHSFYLLVANQLWSFSQDHLAAFVLQHEIQIQRLAILQERSALPSYLRISESLPTTPNSITEKLTHDDEIWVISTGKEKNMQSHSNLLPIKSLNNG
ncbi:hypothetical protein ACSLBF_19150 (plasmid) [Pseudoalteromonas sp. T1lg65]|uniref:hypothetical protein n=1 Tax=Pseudoalteromonas sp. T1lg65 TaxID=2077101 RepID=UPI003F7B069C